MDVEAPVFNFAQDIADGANSLWSTIDLDILWDWLPSDIIYAIGAIIGLLFLLAIKRVFLN